MTLLNVPSAMPIAAAGGTGRGAAESDAGTDGSAFGAVLALLEGVAGPASATADAEGSAPASTPGETGIPDEAVESSAAASISAPSVVWPRQEAAGRATEERIPSEIGGGVVAPSVVVADREPSVAPLALAVESQPGIDAGTLSPSASASADTVAAHAAVTAATVTSLAPANDVPAVEPIEARTAPSSADVREALTTAGTPSRSTAAEPPAPDVRLPVWQAPADSTAGTPDDAPRRSGTEAIASPTAVSAPANLSAPSTLQPLTDRVVAPAARVIAAQVAPAVVSIVQRPVGTHQLTMTVDPESLGPVTVRAHIGHGGEVRVELVGATELGRDALRAIVADLRRDLTATLPNATLTLASAVGADAGGADRGAYAGPGEGFQGQRPRDQAPSNAHAGTSPVDSTDQRRTLATPLPSYAMHGVGLDVLV